MWCQVVPLAANRGKCKLYAGMYLNPERYQILPRYKTTWKINNSQFKNRYGVMKESKKQEKDNTVRTERFQITGFSVTEYKIAMFNMPNEREV